MEHNELTMEDLLFRYLDKIKFLFSPDQWASMFLEYSKNEIFAMLFLYRNKQVNMTEIARDLNVPLNTATGVITRLEKKDLVIRERNSSDKRVVTISITEHGRELMKEELAQVEYYMMRIVGTLTKEEEKVAFQLIDKIIKILNEKKQEPLPEEKKVRQILIE